MNILSNKILNFEQTSFAERNIISIHGMPFYKSSGQNSCYSDTWFPFLGVLQEDVNIFLSKGWFIKPQESNLPKDVKDKMDELFPSYGAYRAGQELRQRFSNIPCLLLSSYLGGGLWESNEGKQFRRFLSEKYPDFYEKMPKISLLPIKKYCRNEEEVNQWLCEKAGISNYNDLKNYMPMELGDIKFQVARQSNAARRREKALGTVVLQRQQELARSLEKTLLTRYAKRNTKQAEMVAIRTEIAIYFVSNIAQQFLAYLNTKNALVELINQFTPKIAQQFGVGIKPSMLGAFENMNLPTQRAFLTKFALQRGLSLSCVPSHEPAKMCC
ncbi:hypothetical protein [Candidatus Berkiella aquae]|uniref:Uncharacterized protein n=1 Tax=Candidatus Berkiella aquae TaxID=295108 RepID=A0A0Q9YXJ2_9GAMM|nr:hypothetical protein [Candidatus Berkiella aquae]MCS5711333.1 hypothetical protein [Candidatus Berkiella aquae]